MNKPLVVIAGPTACGKTALSVRLAKMLGSSVISADSMQVYKLMNIGTAKPTLEEMQGVKHYLIDELYPDEPFSVAEFQSRALAYAQEVHRQERLPVVAGGTGFYINALTNDTSFESADADQDYRAGLYKLAEQEGNQRLHEMLRQVDPVAAETIHFNNVKRVVRALEFFNTTKTKISSHNEANRLKKGGDIVVLYRQRQILYDGINRRVDRMIDDGLIDEVDSLLRMGYPPSLQSMQGIGYKEVVTYLQGEVSREEAVERIKINSRHYAKRQLTWFKHQTDGLWIDVDEEVDVLKSVIDFYKSKRGYECYF